MLAAQYALENGHSGIVFFACFAQKLAPARKKLAPTGQHVFATLLYLSADQFQLDRFEEERGNEFIIRVILLRFVWV